MADSVSHNGNLLGSSILRDSSDNLTTTTTGIFIDVLTKEECDRLAELEKELKKHKKQKKLKMFKELPAHVRQRIVDESYVNDFVRDMYNVDSSGFEHEEEFRNLNARDNRLRIDNAAGFGESFYRSRYDIIFEQFTGEQLADAHGAATLEESLGEE